MALDKSYVYHFMVDIIRQYHDIYQREDKKCNVETNILCRRYNPWYKRYIELYS
jgi:hypothetical protein